MNPTTNISSGAGGDALKAPPQSPAPISTAPTTTTPSVLTSTPASTDLANIQQQHSDIVNGIKTQATNVATKKATTAAQTQAQQTAATQAASDKALNDAKITALTTPDTTTQVATAPTAPTTPNGTLGQYSASTPSGATIYYDQSGGNVTDANGNPVTYNNQTGAYTYADGTPISNNTTTNTTGTPSLSDQLSQKQSESNQAQIDYQTAATNVQNTINNIQSGVIPLTPAEQAQVDGLTQQFQQLISQQTLKNTSASGVANTRGYAQGAAEYDPTFQANIIGSVVTAGLNKISDLNTKMASAVATLTQSLKNNDIKAVTDAWGIYQQASQERITSLNSTITNTQKAISDAKTLQMTQTQNDINNQLNAEKFDYQQTQDSIKNALAQGQLDQKTAADLATEATAREVANKGLYQVKTNLGGSQSIFNTETGQMEGSGSSSTSAVPTPSTFTISRSGSNTGFPSIDSAMSFTGTGVPYIDTSNLSAPEKLQAAEVAKEYQQQHGVPLAIVNPKDAPVLNNIDATRSSLAGIKATLAGLSPNNPFTRPFDTIWHQTEKWTQLGGSSQNIGNYDEWKSSMIQAIKAIGGSGTVGARGSSLITDMMNNIPSINDTAKTAAGKLAVMSSLLDSSEKSIVGTQAFDAANPDAAKGDLQTFYSASPQNSSQVDSLLKANPTLTDSQILQIVQP